MINTLRNILTTYLPYKYNKNKLVMQPDSLQLSEPLLRLFGRVAVYYIIIIASCHNSNLTSLDHPIFT